MSQKTGPLLHFQISSPNLVQYQHFMVHTKFTLQPSRTRTCSLAKCLKQRIFFSASQNRGLTAATGNGFISLEEIAQFSVSYALFGHFTSRFISSKNSAS